MSTDTAAITRLPQILEAQKRAASEQETPSADERRARLQKMIDLLVRYHKPLTEAIDADFGGRLVAFSIMNDILGAITSLKHTRDSLESWMEDEERPPYPPYDQLGAKAYIQYQPKGSVGIIGTWNAPLFTLLSPLACALGAGNRAILKPSEIVPQTAQVLADAVAEMFDPTEVAVVTGGPEVADAFTSLPFDPSSSPAARRSASSSWPTPPRTSYRSPWNWVASRRRSSGAAPTSTTQPTRSQSRRPPTPARSASPPTWCTSPARNSTRSSARSRSRTPRSCRPSPTTRTSSLW